MGMSQSYGVPDDTESVATVHRALELGCDFFDTAEIYGPFVNEELLGRALRDRRDEAIIATKFGWHITPEGAADGPDSRPEHIREVLEQQLRRLGTDHIDLLYQHRVDPNVPIEDVAGTVGEFVQAGKVRYFGLSEAGADVIRRAHATFPVSALQSEYSLWERDLESEVIPVAARAGHRPRAVLPARPRVPDRHRAAGRGLPGERLPPRTTRASRAPTSTSTRRRPTPYARWPSARASRRRSSRWRGCCTRATDLVPIPGTKRRTTLEENLAAAEVELSAEELSELELPVSGDRYPEQMMRLINR